MVVDRLVRLLIRLRKKIKFQFQIERFKIKRAASGCKRGRRE
jgi:hypothetical protein